MAGARSLEDELMIVPILLSFGIARKRLGTLAAPLPTPHGSFLQRTLFASL